MGRFVACLQVFKTASPFVLHCLIRTTSPDVAVARDVTRDDLQKLFAQLRNQPTTQAGPTEVQEAYKAVRHWMNTGMDGCTQWWVSAAGGPPDIRPLWDTTVW